MKIAMMGPCLGGVLPFGARLACPVNQQFHIGVICIEELKLWEVECVAEVGCWNRNDGMGEIAGAC